ncbi:SCO family protein [Arenimonas alkanexedens]
MRWLLAPRILRMKSAHRTAADTHSMLKSSSRWIVPLLAAVGLAVALWAWLQSSGPVAAVSPELQSVLWPVARPVAPFRMRTHLGDSFDERSFEGQWNFVFFGFLQCPDVCPTTLQSLQAFRRELLETDPAAARHRFVFVTVDPDRDTAEKLGPYLGYFDPEFIGLLDEGEELAKLAGSMAVYYASHEDESGGISFEHTTSIMVVDPAGSLVGALPSPHDPAQMLRRFQALQQHSEVGSGKPD